MQIKLNRSRIAICPYKLGDSPTLEKRLSLWNRDLKKYTSRFYLFNKDTKTLYVPYGLGLDEVENCLIKDNINDIKRTSDLDKWSPHRELTVFNIKDDYYLRDEHQVNFVNFLLNKGMHNKFLTADTGYGKTFSALFAASNLQIPTLIVVPLSSLILQWKNSILEFTDCKEDEIYIIKGTPSVKKILKTKDKYINHRFYVASTQTLALAINREKDKNLEAVIFKLGIGLTIIDEAHKMFVSNFMITLATNTRYTYFLTATPGRTSFNEKMMFDRITATIPKFGSYTTVLHQYVTTVNVHIDTKPSPLNRKMCYIYKKGFSALRYETFVFDSIKRISYWVGILHKICAPILKESKENKVLIILTKKEHMELFKKITKILFNVDVGLLNSDVKFKEKEEQKEKQIIVTSVGSSGLGLNIQSLRAIVCFSPFSSEYLLHQLYGRLRYIYGKAVYYFNIVDEGFYDAVKQHLARNKFLINKSATVKNINLSMNKILDYLNDVNNFNAVKHVIQEYIMNKSSNLIGGKHDKKYKRY